MGGCVTCGRVSGDAIPVAVPRSCPGVLPGVIPGPGVLVLASGGWLDGVPLAACSKVCVAVAEGAAVGAPVSWGGDEAEGVAVGVLVSWGGDEAEGAAVGVLVSWGSDEAEGVAVCWPGSPVAVGGTGVFVALATAVGVDLGSGTPVAVDGTGVFVGLRTGVGVLVLGTVWRSGNCAPRAHARSPAGSDAASQADSIMTTRMPVNLRYFICQTPTVKQAIL
jgi:hypothetical protein